MRPGPAPPPGSGSVLLRQGNFGRSQPRQTARSGRAQHACPRAAGHSDASRSRSVPRCRWNRWPSDRRPRNQAASGSLEQACWVRRSPSSCCRNRRIPRPAVWFGVSTRRSCRSRGRQYPSANAPQRGTWRGRPHSKNAAGTRSGSEGSGSWRVAPASSFVIGSNMVPPLTPQPIASRIDLAKFATEWYQNRLRWECYRNK
jgi:hypothetical protein